MTTLDRFFSSNGVVNVVKRNKMLMKLSNRLISNIRRNPLLSRTKETKKLFNSSFKIVTN